MTEVVKYIYWFLELYCITDKLLYVTVFGPSSNIKYVYNVKIKSVKIKEKLKIKYNSLTILLCCAFVCLILIFVSSLLAIDLVLVDLGFSLLSAQMPTTLLWIVALILI